MGMVTGKQLDYNADFVFGTIQTISKEETLIHVETMTEKEALQKLEDQKISGIFYGTETPSTLPGKKYLL